jgi:putative ABC transport system permease protein
MKWPTLVKMASRNIWRNKRRTFITAASIMFAVFAAVSVSSIQVGAWDHMVNSIVNYHFGYAQIHRQGYWDEKTIDNAFEINEDLDILYNSPDIIDLVPRIESFALASNQSSTKGVMLIGVDPGKEDALTNLSSRIAHGAYFNDSEPSALVAEGLAEYLNLELDDTLILISQGYHGINAAGKYPVRGLVHFGSPELNKQMVYLPLEEAKWFYGTEGLITTLVLKTDAPDDIKRTVSFMRANLEEEKYEVLDYEEMIPDLIQARELDTVGAQIILLILYVLIAFGIFGTMLMMLKERQYEFGVLKAIGMKTHYLGFMLWLETIFLGVMGCIAGIVISFPTVYHFHENPITLKGDMATAYEKFGVEPVLPAAMDSDIFIGQAIVVFIMISIMSVIPVIKLKKLKPVEAMRS